MPALSFDLSAVPLDKKLIQENCSALCGKTLTLAVSRPLTLSLRGPDVPRDTMSNSTWLSYLAPGYYWTTCLTGRQGQETKSNCGAD